MTFCWADGTLGEGVAYEKYFIRKTNEEYFRDGAILGYMRNGLFQFLTPAQIFDDLWIDYKSPNFVDELKIKDIFENNPTYCNFVDDVKYCDDFVEKYNIKRGDIIQMDYQGDGILYDHTLYVWCTEPEIRVCSNSDDYFGKKLSDIAGKNKNAIYRIIRTTDHAIAKSAW